MMHRILFVLLALGFTSPGLLWSQMKAVPDQIRLDQIPRVFSLSVASSNPAQLMVATQFGLFLAKPEGIADRLTGVDGVLMAFAVNPKNPKQLLVGGHPGQNGSIGVLESKDGGKKWRQISNNGAGNVGFHLLEFSKKNPKLVFGISKALRISRDGGKSWADVGPTPEGLIDFAASSADENTVFAATQKGLLVSRNQGKSWKPSYARIMVASMVYAVDGGKTYAFVPGVGLIAAEDNDLHWKPISDKFDDQILLRMTNDPKDKNRLYAATLTGAVVTSGDGGKNWRGYEGSHNASAKTIAMGEKLYIQNCQVCHGEKGRGQHTVPGFNAKAPPPFVAPALDDTAHAWHHSDSDLANTILNGSPQKESPMVAWKGKLSKSDAESLVAYMKSLWSFRSVSCQGARHMSCMKHR